MPVYLYGLNENEDVVFASYADRHSVQWEPIWYDMVSPTLEEEHWVESEIKTNVPTRYEMHELELSNRLYLSKGAVHCTTTIVTHLSSVEPEIHNISLILKGRILVSLRYADSALFENYAKRLISKTNEPFYGSKIMMDLIESIMNSLADALEVTAHTLDRYNLSLFRPSIIDLKTRHSKNPDFEDMLRQLGIQADVLFKGRDSLLGLSRLLLFIETVPDFDTETDESKRIHILKNDVSALNDHATFLIGKLSFLLDATLGLSEIQQTSILKMFSVVSIMFLPPTFIAALYGMNFKLMPELNWTWGYPFALFLMGTSSLISYQFFKRKKWL